MKKSMQFQWILAVLLLISVISAANATVFRSGERISIPEGTTIDDEVYAFGQSIVVSGKATSDLTAAANDIRVSEQGSVGGSAIIAGSMVNIAGKVTNNLRAAGSSVTVSSVIGQNAALAGSEVMLAGAAKVGRDLFAAGSTVDIEGSVGRNLKVSAETATVNSPINGDVTVDANQINIGPDAVIKGNLTYTSPAKPKIDPGAQILGKTIQKAREARRNEFAPLKWFFWAVGFVSLFLTGLLLLALAPVVWTSAADRALGNPWISILVGFILLILVPALVLVLMFTLVGIPLALILLAWYFIVLFICRIVIALAVGRWILTRGGRPEPSRYLAFFVGLLIYWVLTAIPIIGSIISFAGLLISLGSLAWTRYEFARLLRVENKL